MDFNLAQGIGVLERTPGTLRALLTDLDAAWLDATEGPETWSPYAIVGHLVHGERTDWIPRARVILSRSASRRLPAYDRFAHVRESQGAPLCALLDDFERLRSENLATLAAWRVSDAELALEGEHPELGPVTLRQRGRTGVVEWSSYERVGWDGRPLPFGRRASLR